MCGAARSMEQSVLQHLREASSEEEKIAALLLVSAALFLLALTVAVAP